MEGLECAWPYLLQMKDLQVSITIYIKISILYSCSCMEVKVMCQIGLNLFIDIHTSQYLK